MSAPDARQIYQEQMERLSRAAFQGDIEHLLAHLALPCRIVMADCDAVITAGEELDFLIQDYVSNLSNAGVVGEREWCVEASFVSGAPDMIAGTHLTEWTYHNGQPPHRLSNRMVLIKLEGVWKQITLHIDLTTSRFEFLSQEFVIAQAKMLGHMGVKG
jgi:hypothetical protein